MKSMIVQEHEAPIGMATHGTGIETGWGGVAWLRQRKTCRRELGTWPVGRVDLLAALVAALTGLAAGPCERRTAAPRLPAPTDAAAASAVSAGQSGAPATAVFAAGCFWCVEAVFAALEGVIDVVSGYAGGAPEDAKYALVAAGRTKHAEAVRVRYDPERITYGMLLHVFFSTHDPTTKDRQGPDVGPQYRSAIFVASVEERSAAEAYMRQLETSRALGRKIVTTIEPLERFHDAEPEHQDFVARNPDHPYVMRWALPKLQNLQATFPKLLRTSESPSTLPSRTGS